MGSEIKVEKSCLNCLFLKVYELGDPACKWPGVPVPEWFKKLDPDTIIPHNRPYIECHGWVEKSKVMDVDELIKAR